MDALLSIKDLKVANGGRQVLDGFSLTVGAGQIHVLMGPNGSGKTTLASVLAGREGYEVNGGTVTFNGADLLVLLPEERARQGLFLGFQHPVEIPGLANATFLREAYNTLHEGEDELDAADFLAMARRLLQEVELSDAFLSRGLNQGFSGGEKKRNEMLQLLLFKPRLAILDEIDSGLDVDGLRLIAKLIVRRRNEGASFLIISHNPQLLRYVAPDAIHVLYGGRLVVSGGADIAETIAERGYEWLGNAHDQERQGAIAMAGSVGDG